MTRRSEDHERVVLEKKSAELADRSADMLFKGVLISAEGSELMDQAIDLIRRGGALLDVAGGLVVGGTQLAEEADRLVGLWLEGDRLGPSIESLTRRFDQARAGLLRDRQHLTWRVASLRAQLR